MGGGNFPDHHEAVSGEFVTVTLYQRGRGYFYPIKENAVRAVGVELVPFDPDLVIRVGGFYDEIEPAAVIKRKVHIGEIGFEIVLLSIGLAPEVPVQPVGMSVFVFFASE
jgi:hypothetical protein